MRSLFTERLEFLVGVALAVGLVAGFYVLSFSLAP